MATFKKRENYDPDSYQPISLISITCRCLEHIIAEHIMLHLETTPYSQTANMELGPEDHENPRY